MSPSRHKEDASKANQPIWEVSESMAQLGGYRRLGFAGDRCRAQVQAQRASERIYCPSSVDCSASRTACRPLRVFGPSNATHDCIDSTRMRAFRFQVYKVGLHITYDGRNRHLVAGVAPRSCVGNPVNVGTGDCQRDGNESLCGHATQQTIAGECCSRSHNYVPGRQSRRRACGLYSRLSDGVH